MNHCSPLRSLLYTAFFLITFSSCNNEPMVLDYCQMLKDDQSYVNQDKSDMVKFNSDKATRATIFAKNFNLLMAKTKRDGFPKAHLASTQSEGCMLQAVRATLIHTAQSNPALFFSRKMASTFKKEIDKGNLDPELLKRASIVAARTIDLCHSLKPDIDSALHLWGLDVAIFDEASFVTCDS